MLYLRRSLVLLHLISGICNAAYPVIYPNQTLSGITAGHSSKPMLNNSAISSSRQTHNSTQITIVSDDDNQNPNRTPSRLAAGRSSESMLNNSANPSYVQAYNNTHIKNVSSDDSQNMNDSGTELPAPFYNIDPWGRHMRNYQHILSGFCDLSDAFCSFQYSNGTMRKAKPRSMDDMCLLWDSSCSGDRKSAIEKFFDSTVRLGGNSCFEQTPGIGSTACLKWNPSSRLLEWQKIRQWMKTSQCPSALGEYNELKGINNTNSKKFFRDVSTCCLRCYIQAENVDLYYWPEPDADTSCLSVIGGSIRPIDYGATKALATVFRELTETVETVTYWGCKGKTLKTDVLSYQGHLTTWFSRDMTMTAKVTTIGSLSVKISMYNPWSSAPCDQEDATSRVQSVTIEPRAQTQPLTIPSSITQKNDGPKSVVSEGFTL